MSNPYKIPKIDENALTPCAKCECLILSDSSDPSNDKCVRIRKTPIDDPEETTSEAIVVRPRANSTLKVVLSGTSESSVDKSTSTDEKTNRIEAKSEDEKRHICFRFCKKKKKDTGPKTQNDSTQTSKPPQVSPKPPQISPKPAQISPKPAQISPKPPQVSTKTQMSETGLENLIKTCTNLGKTCTGSGGCNTNTIIFQKDPASGDGMACLENWLKMEAKANSRNLEEILGELHKQRREMLELKEMLDVVVRALRDQLFMTTFGKPKNELFTDFNRKNNLERKSNTLSMAKSAESAKVTKVTTVAAEPPPEKKKKSFFPWCK